MNRTALFVCALLMDAPATQAQEEVEISIDLLDASDPGGPPPAGIVVADIYMQQPELMDARWFGVGIAAQTFNGATLRYITPNGEDPDPNTPHNQALYDTGLADRNVTMFSRPRGRNADNRFTNSNAVPLGSYQPASMEEIVTPTELNVAMVVAALFPPVVGVSGYVARIALDVSALGLPQSAYFLGTPNNPPAGAVPIFVSESNGDGTIVTTDYGTPGFDWCIYATIPEPSGCALCAAGLVVLVRCRRRVAPKCHCP